MGDLGGVEELGAFFDRDGSDEHAVPCAGDEVADAFEVNEVGHGVAIRCGSVAFGEDIAYAFLFFGVEAPLPRRAASGDGGVCGRGFGGRIGIGMY